MSNSFDAFLEQILLSKSNYKPDYNDERIFCNRRELSKEFRKILDKIAVEVLYDRFESEKIIQAILELTRVERIIVIFHIILGMTKEEIVFLLDADMNCIYTYKCRALQKLKQYIQKNDLF